VCVDVGASGAGSILPRRFARGRVVGLQKLNRTHLSADSFLGARHVSPVSYLVFVGILKP
jgi:hypothetical protein